MFVDEEIVKSLDVSRFEQVRLIPANLLETALPDQGDIVFLLTARASGATSYQQILMNVSSAVPERVYVGTVGDFKVPLGFATYPRLPFEIKNSHEE